MTLNPIDSFREESFDATNAEIVKLKGENTNLSEQIKKLNSENEKLKTSGGGGAPDPGVSAPGRGPGRGPPGRGLPAPPGVDNAGAPGRGAPAPPGRGAP